eukprot:SAG31_NODE_7292_length_1730_cov_1.390558_2_plen_439_part_01
MSIAEINSRAVTTGIHAQFSTPSRFAAALNAEEIEFPPRPANWDMLPLVGDEMGAPWSGFFTSRPGFKALVRASSSTWRASQQLHAIRRDEKQWLRQFAELLPIWKAMGLAVAHDALPGDGFGIVSNDFTNRLIDGIERASDIAAEGALGLLANSSCAAAGAHLQPCINASGMLCPVVTKTLFSSAGVMLSVYNPQMTVRPREHVELLVPATAGTLGLTVVSGDGDAPVACQLSPAPAKSASPSATHDVLLLTFSAINLQPLALHSFVVRKAAENQCVMTSPASFSPAGATLESNTGTGISLFFNASGALQTIKNGSAPEIIASARVLNYRSSAGSENSWDFSTNGNGPESAVPFPGEPTQTATLLSGPVFDEVAISVDKSQGISLRFRLYHDAASHVHVFVASGPFDVDGGKLDANVILRFETNIASGGRMLVDSNAM